MSFWEDPEQVERFAGRDPDLRLIEVANTFADPATTTVMDLGCAGGRNTVFLAERGFDVFALDSAHAMVARTRSRVATVLGEAEAKRRVRFGTMEKLDEFPDGFFGLVVALGIYHNATTPDTWYGALRETGRVLKPGGLLLVSNFSPRTRPQGVPLKAVPGEDHLYRGFPSSPVYLVEAADLDADMRTHGFMPRSETVTVQVESEWGSRVSVNGLYVQQGSGAPRPLVILKTGTTHDTLKSEAGDFEDWILQGVGRPDLEVVVKHTTEVEALPDPETVAGVVITASHDMVADETAWLGVVVAWLRSVVEASIPTLGICYGHQLLAHALGGQVGYNPRGREVGTVSVQLLPDGKADPLLGVMPASFPAQVTHSQSVLVLPEGATPLARSENEENHAFRVGSCAWGLQFHPEFSEAVMRRYIELEADELRGEGLNADELRSSVKPSPAERLLGVFGDLL